MLDDDGVSVETVLVNDDVAVEDSLYTAGRRGTGATVLLEKIAGAKAEQGGVARRTVAAVARRVNDRARSFGVALTLVHPAGGRLADLPDQPGRDRARRRHPRRAGTAPGAAGQRGGDGGADARRRFSTTSGWSRARACWPSSTAWAARRRSSSTCCSASCRSCSPSGASRSRRSLVGPYITSLEMAGASFTLLELDDELDGAVGCSGPHRRRCAGASDRRSDDERPDRHALDGGERRRDRREPDYLTQLDAAIGDADHGANMDRGFAAVVSALDGLGDRPARQAADRRRQDAGLDRRRGQRPALGHRAAREPGKQLGDEPEFDGPAIWPTRWMPRWPAVVELGAAEAGDKTMVDALAPAVRATAARRGRRRRGRCEALDDGRGRGRGRDAGDDADAGAQGPRLLPRRAVDRPPGPRRDVGCADRRGARPSSPRGGMTSVIAGVPPPRAARWAGRGRAVRSMRRTATAVRAASQAARAQAAARAQRRTSSTALAERLRARAADGGGRDRRDRRPDRRRPGARSGCRARGAEGGMLRRRRSPRRRMSMADAARVARRRSCCARAPPTCASVGAARGELTAPVRDGAASPTARACCSPTSSALPTSPSSTRQSCSASRSPRAARRRTRRSSPASLGIPLVVGAGGALLAVADGQQRDRRRRQRAGGGRSGRRRRARRPSGHGGGAGGARAGRRPTASLPRDGGRPARRGAVQRGHRGRGARRPGEPAPRASGLLRTELPFLDAAAWPTRTEHAAALRPLLDRLARPHRRRCACSTSAATRRRRSS